MEQVILQVNDTLSRELKQHRDDIEEILTLGLQQQARIRHALREYQEGRASIGHAAFLAGLTVQEIIQHAVKHGVKPQHWDEEMIRDELTP